MRDNYSKSYAFLDQGRDCIYSNPEKYNGFHKYDVSDAHMEAAMARYTTAPAASLGDGDVGELCHVCEASPRKDFKVYEFSLPSCLISTTQPNRTIHCMRRGQNAATENSNFYQLLRLRSEENPEMMEQLWTDNYTCPTIQNDTILALGL